MVRAPTSSSQLRTTPMHEDVFVLGYRPAKLRGQNAKGDSQR
jgi:hypothetical protein